MHRGSLRLSGVPDGTRMPSKNVGFILVPVHLRWRRKWQPTPVFLLGESQGRQSLMGCRLWVCTESDMTEAT